MGHWHLWRMAKGRLAINTYFFRNTAPRFTISKNATMRLSQFGEKFCLPLKTIRTKVESMSIETRPCAQLRLAAGRRPPIFSAGAPKLHASRRLNYLPNPNIGKITLSNTASKRNARLHYGKRVNELAPSGNLRISLALIRLCHEEKRICNHLFYTGALGTPLAGCIWR